MVDALMSVSRTEHLARIDEYFRSHSSVAILGPRQCGKTTLARDYIARFDAGQVHFFDLEDPDDINRLSDPRLTLERLRGLIVIDEVQRIPDLFPLLRVLLDRRPLVQRYLILGSASRDLIRQSSESLAGRIAYLNLTPFTIAETGDTERLWLRGGFPRAYLLDDARDSFNWRSAYITNLLEKDLPALGVEFSATRMRRLWAMLAHYHGKVFNASDLARSLDVSQPTIRRYLDLLAGTFMIRLLQPWFANIGKRQVKSPKVYFRDAGILHYFYGVSSADELFKHPSVGASWEGFAMEQVIETQHALWDECYFWAKHSEAELDLLLVKGQAFSAFEFKFSSAPKITPSMRSAIRDLGLSHISVVYPGDHSYPLSEHISVASLKDLIPLRETK